MQIRANVRPGAAILGPAMPNMQAVSRKLVEEASASLRKMFMFMLPNNAKCAKVTSHQTCSKNT